MGNVIPSGEVRTHSVELPKHTGDHQYIEDCSSAGSSRQQSGVESDRRVRFKETTVADGRNPGNVVLVKANENRSSASSSGYESKSCSSMDDGEIENVREEISSVIKDILTCSECGDRFSKSGLYLAHIRTRTQGGCVSNGALEEVVIEKNSEMDYPKSLADSIRKTKSYNQERDLLWIPPEKLRPKSARPEHRMLGPLGNSYLHWLSHLERLDQMSDESSEATEEMERSPPSTGESTLC